MGHSTAVLGLPALPCPRPWWQWGQQRVMVARGWPGAQDPAAVSPHELTDAELGWPRADVARARPGRTWVGIRAGEPLPRALCLQPPAWELYRRAHTPTGTQCPPPCPPLQLHHPGGAEHSLHRQSLWLITPQMPLTHSPAAAVGPGSACLGAAPCLGCTGVPHPHCRLLQRALLTQVPTQHNTNLAMGWCFPASPKVPTLVGTGIVKGKANRDEERGKTDGRAGREVQRQRRGRRASAAQRHCPRYRSSRGRPFPSSR